MRSPDSACIGFSLCQHQPAVGTRHRVLLGRLSSGSDPYRGAQPAFVYFYLWQHKPHVVVTLAIHAICSSERQDKLVNGRTRFSILM